MLTKIKLKTVAIVLCLPVVISGIAWAEEAEFYLDPMIVVADRYGADDPRPGYYTIDAKQLETGNYESALDVIQELPGVTIASQGASGGFNAYSNILLNGSDRYVVVVDGMRSNWNGSSYNDFDFSVLPADMLASVEVLPAAAGAIYGNAAKGGVIKITTKKAVDGVKTSINLETGSYGRERENILHLGKKGDWSWSVYAQKSIVGDYSSARQSIPSYENTENADVKITRSWGEAADLTLSYSAYSGRYTSKIFRTNKDKVPAHRIVDGRKTEHSFALEYDRKISDSENNVFGIYRRTSDSIYDAEDDPTAPKPWIIDLRTEGFFDRYSNIWHPKNIFTGGVEYYKEYVLRHQNLVDDYNNKSIISKAIYMQNEWQMDEVFKVTGSLRQDYNSHAGNKLSPALALEYKPTDKLRYTLSYTEYFAPPKQLYLFYRLYGDEALQPEYGKIYEFGTTYTPDSSLTFKANIFHRNATNVIALDTSVTPWRYANVAREKATGFTVSADKRLSDSWRTSVSYTQTNVDTKRPKGSISTMIPHGELLINLLYDKDKYSGLVQGRAIFDQTNGRGENRYANNNYWVWNASLNYKVNKNAKIYVKVNNIFDQFYSSCDNTSVLQDGSRLPFDEWYAEPGRNYQIGINYTF